MVPRLASDHDAKITDSTSPAVIPSGRAATTGPGPATGTVRLRERRFPNRVIRCPDTVPRAQPAGVKRTGRRHFRQVG